MDGAVAEAESVGRWAGVDGLEAEMGVRKEGGDIIGVGGNGVDRGDAAAACGDDGPTGNCDRGDLGDWLGVINDDVRVGGTTKLSPETTICGVGACVSIAFGLALGGVSGAVVTSPKGVAEDVVVVRESFRSGEEPIGGRSGIRLNVDVFLVGGLDTGGAIGN